FTDGILIAAPRPPGAQAVSRALFVGVRAATAAFCARLSWCFLTRRLAARAEARPASDVLALRQVSRCALAAVGSANNRFQRTERGAMVSALFYVGGPLFGR